MDYPPIPQFWLDFLLRSKTYLKERPPSVLSIANLGISIVYQAQGCGEIGLHTLQGANYTAAQWFTRCLAHDVTHYLHHFERLAVITSTQYCYLECQPTTQFEPNVRCTTHGPSFVRQQ